MAITNPATAEYTRSVVAKVYGTAESGKKIKDVKLVQFDTSTGNDRLLALANTTLYASTDPNVSGSFASLKSGLNSSATGMSVAHMNDRWYFANGYDQVQAIEDDGTVRVAGMNAPTSAPVLSTTDAGVANVQRAATGSGTFTNEANIWDADGATYADATMSGQGTTTTTISWDTNLAETGRRLDIEWGVAGYQQNQTQKALSDIFDDVGGSLFGEWSVTVKLEVSEDAGVNYTTVANETITTPQSKFVTQVDVSDGDMANNLKLKATLTYNNGLAQASLRIYDARLTNAGGLAAFTMTTGVYVAYTEFDQTRPGAGESPLSESTFISASNWGTSNLLTITLPAAAINSRATHRRIYITTDGGSTPSGLGFVVSRPVADTSIEWGFEGVGNDKDTQRFPLAPLLKMSTARSDDASGSALYFPQNSPPPELIKLRTFKGSLVGLSRNNPRKMYYSMPGRPEAWPPIYVIESFPLEEHDKLLDVIEVGDALIIAAEEAMMRTFKLPRIVQGTFDASNIAKVAGAPGCVGRRAMVAMDINGDSHAAWISHDGIFVTNGETFSSISDDHIDWYSAFEGVEHAGTQITHAALADQSKSNWVIHWDKHRRLLYIFFSSVSGGTNDLYYTVRIPTGRANDQRPRWSGPHPGDVNSVTSGRIDGQFRMWTGHTSDGKVYTEWIGSDDDSNSYDTSGNWPLIVRSRRVYGEGNEWSALSGNLRHTDFGTGQTATVVHTAGRDSPAEESSLTQTVALSGQRGTHYDVAKGGEWQEWSIAHTGTAKDGAALLEQQIEARGLGDRGTVKVA